MSFNEFEFLTVHKRNPKTGEVVEVNPYVMVVDAKLGTYFIRNGKKYLPNGQLVPEYGKEEVAAPVVEEATKEAPKVIGKR